MSLTKNINKMKIIITNESYFLDTFSKLQLNSFKKDIADEVTKRLESNLDIPANLAIDRKDHSIAVEIFVLNRFIRTRNGCYFYYEYVGGAS